MAVEVQGRHPYKRQQGRPHPTWSTFLRRRKNMKAFSKMDRSSTRNRHRPPSLPRREGKLQVNTYKWSFQRYRKISPMAGNVTIHSRFEGVNHELRNYKSSREKVPWALTLIKLLQALTYKKGNNGKDECFGKTYDLFTLHVHLVMSLDHQCQHKSRIHQAIITKSTVRSNKLLRVL